MINHVHYIYHYIHHYIYHYIYIAWDHTVDGGNPAPVSRWFIPL